MAHKEYDVRASRECGWPGSMITAAITPAAETRQPERPDPANPGDALVYELGDRAVAALAEAPETDAAAH